MNALDIERQVYASNPVAWFEIYGRIEDKEVGSDPDKAPVANWLQVAVGEAVEFCLKTKRPVRLILYKPRQQGCSTITVEIVYAMSRAVKMKVLVIGGQASQTDNLWKILKHYGNTDKFDWGNTWACNETAGKCSNGSLWERETAGDKEAGRSGNYHAVLATEVARWPTDGAKNAADVLNSVLNCVGGGPGTMVVMESTAQGPKGVFPDTWAGAVSLEDAKAGKWGNGYIKIFAPWFRFPRCWTALLPGEEHTLVETIRAAGDAKALRVMEEFKLPLERVKWYHQILNAPECGGDEMKRDREYPTKEEDGFKASAPSRFDLKALEALDAYAATRKDDVVFGVLEKPRDDKRYQHITFRPCDSKNAEIAILEKPEAGRRYVISTDNGRGKSYTDGGDTDPNAVVVVRQGYVNSRGAWVPPEPVACLMPGNRWDQDVLAELVARLSAYYGGCMIVPESNRGEMLIKELRDKGALLFERERKKAEVDSHKPSNLYGWETTPETKRYLTENLAKHIRELNMMGAGVRIAFPWIIQELRTFVRHKDGTEGALKIAGCHDDFVIALAIALACLESASTYWPQSAPGARPEGLPDEDGQAAEVW
ncbi:MAG TPA: hypothetical protein VD994_09140 [Prosthecobacter sp.]|nr:hypothetical protein [Prosthecobacter sp.]